MEKQRLARAGEILLIAFFFLSSAFFLVMSIAGAGDTEIREKRLNPPEFINPLGEINLDYTTQFSDYFGENFAYRANLIDAYSRLCASVFQTSSVEEVYLGRDGWLFYHETLGNYYGYGRMNEREIESAARSVYLMEEYAKEQGSSFLFVPVPNKNTMNPDKMPHDASDIPTDLDRLMAELETQHLSFIDLRESLSPGDVLYYKGDSHWNMLGAAVAADAIFKALDLESDFKSGMSKTAVFQNGDLFSMLYPVSESAEEDFEYAPGFRFSYVSPFRTPEDMTIKTANEGMPGSLLMFRDSFGNSLHSFMAEGFGDALFSRGSSYKLSLIPQTAASAVIVQTVERNISELCRNAAVFPAPERDFSEVSFPAAELTLFLSAEVSGELPGYIKLMGGLSPLYDGAPATSKVSRIYLSSGGKIYEATPAGDTTNGYPLTAYLPADAPQGEISAIVYIDGIARETKAIVPDFAD